MEESSAKRQKTKGKEIIMEADELEDPVFSPARNDPAAEITCGICLSDVGRSIRGRIDSCEHYFCFVCIMEWAKVETRCPLCKQRFRSIRRPIVPGIFAHERVVDTPERNQVDNESAMLSDPYANITCSECHTGADDEFMLLCDLCDSASHTYCVGLGATVPEGDWYCRDCTQIIEEHSRTQTDSDAGNTDSYDIRREVQASQIAVPVFQMPARDSETQKQASITPVQASQAAVSASQMPARESQTRMQETSQKPVVESKVPVSIFEIISDGTDSNSSQGFSGEQVLEQKNVQQLRRDTAQTQRDSHGRVSYIRETVLSTEARGEQHVRTLQKCRNLQGHIRHIRENWNALRSGSLAFSSSSSNSGHRDYNNKRKNRVNTAISREPVPISSVGREQSADVSASSMTSHSERLQDVDKAWKMMKIAKSMEGTKKRGVLNNSSNLSPKGNNKSKDISNNSKSFLSKGYSAPRGTAGHTAFNLGNKQHECPVHDKVYIEKNMDVAKDDHKAPIKIPQGDIVESSSHKLVGVSSTESVHCQKKPTPNQVVDGGSLSVSKGLDALNSQGSAPCSLSQRSSLPAMDPIVSSCDIVHSHDTKHGAAIVKHFHKRPIEVPRGNIMESSSQKLGGISSKGSVRCQKKPSSQQVADDRSLSASKGWDALNCRDSVPCSLSGWSSLPAMNPIISSCGVVNTKHGTVSSVDKSSSTRNNNMNSNAKDEVRSLVKLNLKLESKDQRLDADTFREVARVATHTILAACGLEHSKSSARTIWDIPKCKHPEQFRERRKSNLMPNSCRECFYSFAKDVVSCVFIEKMGPRNIELHNSNSPR